FVDLVAASGQRICAVALQYQPVALDGTAGALPNRSRALEPKRGIIGRAAEGAHFSVQRHAAGAGRQTDPADCRAGHLALLAKADLLSFNLDLPGCLEQAVDADLPGLHPDIPGRLELAAEAELPGLHPDIPRRLEPAADFDVPACQGNAPVGVVDGAGCDRA